MNKGRKWITALTALLACFALAGFSACGEVETPNDGDGTQTEQPGDNNQGDNNQGDNNQGGDDTPVAVALSAPTVTVTETGMASWPSVANASGYKVKINGVESETAELSVQLNDGATIQVKAMGDGVNFTDSDWSVLQTYTAPVVEPELPEEPTPAPTRLATPTVTVNATGVASWTAVENASGYGYKIKRNNAWLDEETTAELSVQLLDGDIIRVRSLGDGVEYLTSGYCSALEYDADDFNQPEPEPPEEPTPELTQLATPTVTITETGTASWSVANASGYKVKVNGVESETAELSVQLSNGDTIQVKALGDGENFTDSEWSVLQTYTAPVEEPEIPEEPELPQTEKLATPVVTIDEKGVASWEEVPNATKYKIKVNGIARNTTSLSVQLSEGITFQVMAVGDGENYTDSDWSEEQTYVVPMRYETLVMGSVSINENGVASWGAVANAKGYIVKVNGVEQAEQTTREYRLNDDDKIQVKAVGQIIGKTTYYDSAYSVEQEYDAPVIVLATPSVAIDKLGKATWSAITGAEKYAYVVGDGIELYTTERYVKGIPNGETIKVRAVAPKTDDDYADGEYCVVRYTAPATLASPTITVNTQTGVASWAPITGATGYVCEIDGEERAVQTGTSITLTHAQKLRVRAVSTGNYLDGTYSTYMTYRAETIVNNCSIADSYQSIKTVGDTSKSEVNTDATYITEGTTSLKVTTGTSYAAVVVYMRDGETPLFDLLDAVKEVSLDIYWTGASGINLYFFRDNTGAYSWLNPGWNTMTITRETILAQMAETPGVTEGVCAFNYLGGMYFAMNPANAVFYLDNVRVTYDKAIEDTTKTYEKLATPTVQIREDGVAFWEYVERADGYVCMVDGVVQDLGTKNYVQLLHGQSVCVKAKGNNATHVDGLYSVPVRYLDPAKQILATPVVTVDENGVATWQAVEGATAYKYKITGEDVVITTERSVQLTAGQSIAVQAITDDENYVNGGWSAFVKYDD